METHDITNVLPQLFKQTRIPNQAKEKLKQRLFGTTELSDDELDFVVAAGVADQQNIKNQGGFAK